MLPRNYKVLCPEDSPMSENVVQLYFQVLRSSDTGDSFQKKMYVPLQKPYQKLCGISTISSSNKEVVTIEMVICCNKHFNINLATGITFTAIRRL